MSDSPKNSENQQNQQNQQNVQNSENQKNQDAKDQKLSAFDQPTTHSFLNEGGVADFSHSSNLDDASKKTLQNSESGAELNLAAVGRNSQNSQSFQNHQSSQSPQSLQSPSSSQDPHLLLKVISHHLDNLNKELRTARRGRWLGRILLWIFLLILTFIIFGSHLTSNESLGTHNHTAVIEIKGEIAEGELASADNIKYSIQEAFENENAKGIILRINSPGGSPVQAGMIYDEIMRQKQKYPKKKIYAVVEEICASGAYYIAAAADSIYVDKASIVGSIGVLMDGFGFDKTMEKFGVQRRLYTAGINKGMLDPFSPENPKQKEHILAMLDSIHQQFIGAVKKGRGARLKFDKNPDMFTGLFWTGEKSIELGLSDGYGYVDDIADRLIREKQLVDYTVQEDFTDKIAKRFGASLGTNLSTNIVEKSVDAFLQSNTKNNSGNAGIH